MDVENNLFLEKQKSNTADTPVKSVSFSSEAKSQSPTDAILRIGGTLDETSIMEAMAAKGLDVR